jgi:hypothetical protein
MFQHHNNVSSFVQKLLVRSVLFSKSIQKYVHVNARAENPSIPCVLMMVARSERGGKVHRQTHGSEPYQLSITQYQEMHVLRP